jgi:hypothetical protein
MRDANGPRALSKLELCSGRSLVLFLEAMFAPHVIREEH